MKAESVIHTTTGSFNPQPRHREQFQLHRPTQPEASALGIPTPKLKYLPNY